MALGIQGIVKKFVKSAYGNASNDVRLTNFNSVAVAMLEGMNAEAARSGRRFMGGNQIIANGIAPVQAIPTTTATLALWNGETDTGKSLFIDGINYWLGSGTAAAGATLFVTVSPTKIATAPTSMATGYAIQNTNGGAAKSKALFATAVTVPSTPAAPVWAAKSSTLQAAAANVGQGDGWRELNGGLVVPPGYAAGFAILSGAGTTPLYGISLTWNEFDAELE